MEPWKKQKIAQQKAKEAEIDYFIRFSFKKDFKINNRDINLFEPSKILGDVFEAIIGAIFIDGLMEGVLKVFDHLLAPFVLYVAKFSKRLNKEPKEDFLILSRLQKLCPEIKTVDEIYVPFVEHMGEQGLLEEIEK